jgi:hypothetical protein
MGTKLWFLWEWSESWKMVEWFKNRRLSNIKNRHGNPTSVDIPKGMQHRLLQRHLHPHVYCSAIHNSQVMATDEWIKKMWYVYTMEFYSALKKNEILSFASKWMELRTSFWAMSARLRRPKILCSPLYVVFRSRENTAML